MMQFEFATATRILFGRGRVKEAAPLASAMGRRALLIAPATSEHAEVLRSQLGSLGVETTGLSVTGEPKITTVLEGTRIATETQSNLVIGCGGGSVIDTGKAVAALMRNPGDPLDYLEVVGRGVPLTRPSAPYIAIPTTAGTGSEVTRNAVLALPEQRVKVSLRSPLMLPTLAVVDPELTCTMPADITASTGLDALTQLIEPFVCNSPNPITDSLCRDGIRRASLSLRRACENGRDAGVREEMALASLFGGLALANARLGAVHGLAAPLGGMFPAPHGAVCARLLPLVMDANVRALRSRAPASPALDRYHEVARLLTGEASSHAEDAVEWVRSLCADLRISSLKQFGLTKQEIPDVVARGQKASSMKGNPIPLTDEELTAVLLGAL
ncbi:MAG TPA: iron-containing alcohol dehydrogenase [Acidobacteriota bacterium]|nr:iron-containing alcohol dehydrogenase [Acidobacteriota bacterium]